MYYMCNSQGFLSGSLHTCFLRLSQMRYIFCLEHIFACCEIFAGYTSLCASHNCVIFLICGDVSASLVRLCFVHSPNRLTRIFHQFNNELLLLYPRVRMKNVWQTCFSFLDVLSKVYMREQVFPALADVDGIFL